MKIEFRGYSGTKLKKDFFAGMAITAAAYPLALAFGVGSGADAAAGLISAVIAGVVIGMLSGAPYQISGPTGAMSAILVGLVARYSLQGALIATMFSGIILLAAGIFRLGKIVTFIPAPVLAGFTSSIAVNRALGQIDNFFGVESVGNSMFQRITSYFKMGFTPDWEAIVIGGIVIAIMVLWPKKLEEYFPSPLLALIVSTAVSMIFSFSIDRLGADGSMIIPQHRMNLGSVPVSKLHELILPGISIAALGMIESLHCGDNAVKMKPGIKKLNNDRELIAQGIGNIIIPFFGGVPSTAAMARTSVAIRSGAVTRLTSIFHAGGIFVLMVALSPVMPYIPMSALAGILMVAAWRMNEWESIRYIFSHKFKGAIAKFLVTIAATVMFDLATAIVVGVVFSVILFVVRISDLTLEVSDIDPQRMGLRAVKQINGIKVVYFTGPVFFAGVQKLTSKLSGLEDLHLIFSMRGVPLIDTSGVGAIAEFVSAVRQNGGSVQFCGVQPKVRDMLDRAGISREIGEQSYHPDAKKAIGYLLKTNLDFVVLRQE